MGDPTIVPLSLILRHTTKILGGSISVWTVDDHVKLIRNSTYIREKTHVETTNEMAIREQMNN